VDRRGNCDDSVNDAMLAWWKAQGADGVLLGTTGEAVNRYAVSLLVGTQELRVRPPSMPLNEALKPRIAEAVKQLKSLT
jgi:hypothetical protein